MTHEFLGSDGNVDPPAVIPAPTPEQMELPTFTLPAEGEVITAIATGHTYQIGKKIGEGAFGIVYECIDDWDNRLAVKIIKPRQQPYDHIRANALGEIERLNMLRHPNITYVFDAFEYRHTFYVVVERCDMSLADLIATPNFDGKLWIRGIARCVLQAVQFIHNTKMAHQDIHAGNVFWHHQPDELLRNTHATNFKLADLGIAKFVDQMNAENTILADWMRAPEAMNVSEFGPLDHRMDLYHCGLLFLSLLKGETLQYTADDVLAGAPRSDALMLDPPFNFALEKALRRHVSSRTQTARELWRDLVLPP